MTGPARDPEGATGGEDMGTNRWFGPSWGAPVCEYPAARIPTPVGEPCLWCGEPIEADERGVSIPHVAAPDGDRWPSWHYRPQHLACLWRAVAGEAMAERLTRELAERDAAELVRRGRAWIERLDNLGGEA